MAKKICIVSLGYMWFPVESGPSRFFQIAQTFEKSGYEVEIITTDFQHFKKKPRDKELILSQGYPFKITFIETKPYKKNIDVKRVLSNKDAAKKVKNYLLEHIKEYDGVYVAIPANNIAATVSEICKDNHVPCIVDIEDLWPEAMSMVVKSDRLRKVLFQNFQKDAERTYANVNAVVGTSEDYTARANKYNHRTMPMETVYVGCNLSDFDGGVNEHRAEVKKPEGEFWLTYAGSISTSYDIKNVIDAVTMVRSTNEKVQLQILGTGSEKDALEAYVKEEKLEGIHFWGFTDYHKMAAVLAESDVVINSFVKGAPQSIVNKVGDYLASGKPMINTLENPVFTSLVEKHQFGTNVEAGNAKALAEAIERYCKDEALTKEHGLNARKLAETEFDREKSYQKIVKLVEQFI